jgi:hypothetical protein
MPTFKSGMAQYRLVATIPGIIGQSRQNLNFFLPCGPETASCAVVIREAMGYSLKYKGLCPSGAAFPKTDQRRLGPLADNIETVDSLAKVTVSIETGASPEQMDSAGARTGEFIFGIATDGLTPFEARIFGKAPGEEATFSVKPEDSASFMGHLSDMLPAGAAAGEAMFVRVKVLKIRRAEDREVVRTMAEMTACGDGCCGSH